jgi:hypothetical protein
MLPVCVYAHSISQTEGLRHAQHYPHGLHQTRQHAWQGLQSSSHHVIQISVYHGLQPHLADGSGRRMHLIDPGCQSPHSLAQARVGGGQSQAAAVRRLRAGTIFEMTGFGLVLACMVIIGAGLAGSSLF